MLIRKAPDVRPSEITPKHLYLDIAVEGDCAKPGVYALDDVGEENREETGSSWIDRSTNGWTWP